MDIHGIQVPALMPVNLLVPSSALSVGLLSHTARRSRLDQDGKYHNPPRQQLIADKNVLRLDLLAVAYS